jgi:hypothetical protein
MQSVERRVRPLEECGFCCAAARGGDFVQIIDDESVISGRLVQVAHSILHVTPS